jgi:acyl-CoA thioesterase
MSTEVNTPIAAAMELTPLGDGRYRAGNVGMSEQHENLRTVVFGGQLLGQMVAAATAEVPDKKAATVQVVFSRPASTAEDLELVTDLVQNGHSLATVEVSVVQGEKVTSRGIVTLDAGDPDLIRHADPVPDVGDPADASPVDWAEPGSEVRVVDGVDPGSTAATADPELAVWVRFPGADYDDTVNRALLAWYTDMFVMGAAMGPHEGVGFAVAHEKISTGVTTHSLRFHEAWDPSRWFLLSQRANYAGNGRYYGTGSVFSEEGDLVASFSQSGIVRAMPERHGGQPDKRTVM